MKTTKKWRVFPYLIAVASAGSLFGCANHEVNTKRGDIPGYYIRTEMQESDRAVESARQAGKDKTCPAEFKAAEDARDHAYDVFRACHTEEGAALAKKATKLANALCPAGPVTTVAPVVAPVAPVAPVEAVVVVVAEPEAEKIVAVLPKTVPKVVVLALEDIHFDYNQSTLTPEAKTILKRNIQLLKENPKAKIRIAGYTSASGTEAYNQKLSERRAAAVKEYLIAEGVVSPERLSRIGYGETRPEMYEAAPKDLYSKAAKANMRVLFEITVE